MPAIALSDIRHPNARVLAAVTSNRITRKRGSKFNAVRTTVDGITFASRLESDRYRQLRDAERAGHIQDLKTQIPYNLSPVNTPVALRLVDDTIERIHEAVDANMPGQAVYEASLAGLRELRTILRGEQVCRYVADFSYLKSGEFIVEDTKGFLAKASAQTQIFKLKQKLMRLCYGIDVRIITREEVPHGS